MRQMHTTAFSDGAIGPVSIRPGAIGEDLYLFDLESIVSTPRGEVDAGLCAFLNDWAKKHACYLVTSQTYQAVLQTVPSPLRQSFEAVFASSGADVWRQDQPATRLEHEFDDKVYDFLARVVQSSAYAAKKAPVLSAGPATLRLDIAGTTATHRQRQAYIDWEQGTGELSQIQSEFAPRFPDYRICRDGMCGLLITHKAFSSNRAINHMRALHPDARVLGYFRPGSVAGYAADLADGFAGADVLAEVGGPSDLAQLLKYEERRHAVPDASLPDALLRLLEA